MTPRRVQRLNSRVAYRLRSCFSQMVGHSSSSFVFYSRLTVHYSLPLATFPHISTAVTNPLLPSQLPQTSRLPFIPFESAPSRSNESVSNTERY
jgi:hypothetical protein